MNSWKHLTKINTTTKKQSNVTLGNTRRTLACVFCLFSSRKCKQWVGTRGKSQETSYGKTLNKKKIKKIAVPVHGRPNKQSWAVTSVHFAKICFTLFTEILILEDICLKILICSSFNIFKQPKIWIASEKRTFQRISIQCRIHFSSVLQQCLNPKWTPTKRRVSQTDSEGILPFVMSQKEVPPCLSWWQNPLVTCSRGRGLRHAETDCYQLPPSVCLSVCLDNT